MLVRGTYLTNQATMSGIGDIHWTARNAQLSIDGSRPPDYFYAYLLEGYDAILGGGPLVGGQGGRSEGLRSLTRYPEIKIVHTGFRTR